MAKLIFIGKGYLCSPVRRKADLKQDNYWLFSPVTRGIFSAYRCYFHRIYVLRPASIDAASSIYMSCAQDIYAL